MRLGSVCDEAGCGEIDSDHLGASEVLIHASRIRGNKRVRRQQARETEEKSKENSEECVDQVVNGGAWPPKGL